MAAADAVARLSSIRCMAMTEVNRYAAGACFSPSISMRTAPSGKTA